jgi:hypothetical protein
LDRIASHQINMTTPDASINTTESRAVEVNVVAWVFTGIAIATVGLKLAARQIVNRVGWDQFFIFFSLACLSQYSRHSKDMDGSADERRV